MLLPIYHFFLQLIMTPEKKLWLAVILKTIDDAREIRRKINIAKYPNELTFLAKERRIILDEVKSEWFEEICDYADFSHHWMVEEINSIFAE